MRPRAIWIVLGFTTLLAYCWLTIQSYRAASDPEGSATLEAPFAWIIGPAADASAKTAGDRIVHGLEVLNDTSQPAADRIAGYRAELRASEYLLVQSLRAQPTRALVLAQLASVRWELNPPLNVESSEQYLEMIALASEISSESPRVQMKLGELLLNMGRYDEAVPYLAHTVAIDSSTTVDVIETMRNHLFRAKDILAALPRNAHVLAGLQDPFFDQGMA